MATSFPKHRIRVLLLEGLHPVGVERLAQEDFEVLVESRAYSADELAAAIEGVHVLGIRSKTQVDAAVLRRAKKLLTIGAYCIGTNQVDLDVARRQGVPVFHAPHANTRSVAELVIGFVVMLLRGLYPRISGAHAGEWLKTARGSVEVRGKVLGIVGYGHIGQQVSVLAEAMGMRVIFHDVADKLALGNAEACSELGELLERSDLVTLHVPASRETRNLLSVPQFARMRPGAHLINTSRGSVVDIAALAAALESGQVGGAALDVFPEEPGSPEESFEFLLRGRDNVLLTPHIGGSTAEAQVSIGRDVSEKLVRFVNNGSTRGAVNFPEVTLSEIGTNHRILHVHRNVPGVLQKVNALFAERSINVSAQELRTFHDVGYLIADTDRSATREMVRQLRELPETIRARPLF